MPLVLVPATVIDLNEAHPGLGPALDAEGEITGEVSFEDRYYLCSMAIDRLAPDQWLMMIRRRWSVENENHNTFDTVLHEDK